MMIIDPACSVVFEAETEEDDVMRRPPRDPQSALLLRTGHSVFQGIPRLRASQTVPSTVDFLGSVSALLGVAILWPSARSLVHFGQLHWDAAAAGVLSRQWTEPGFLLDRAIRQGALVTPTQLPPSLASLSKHAISCPCLVNLPSETPSKHRA